MNGSAGNPVAVTPKGDLVAASLERLRCAWAEHGDTRKLPLGLLDLLRRLEPRWQAPTAGPHAHRPERRGGPDPGAG